MLATLTYAVEMQLVECRFKFGNATVSWEGIKTGGRACQRREKRSQGKPRVFAEFLLTSAPRNSSPVL